MSSERMTQSPVSRTPQEKVGTLHGGSEFIPWNENPPEEISIVTDSFEIPESITQGDYFVPVLITHPE